MFKRVLFAALLLGMSSAHAAPIQLTATSAASGDLGWFAVDDSILAGGTTSLVASQFLDYWFDDPLSAVALNPGNVDGDTGWTHFGLNSSGVWTVTGGGGDSLTDVTLGTSVWIAGTSYLRFGGGQSYSDVVWSTSAYSSVPVPATLALFGFGLAALGIGRRRKAA
jgi:hypothetical protein